MGKFLYCLFKSVFKAEAEKNTSYTKINSR